MSDRQFIAGIAAAIAGSTGLIHSVPCEVEGCHFTIHAGSPEQAQVAYAEHVRTDPRHTGGEWIDRDGREWRGLELVTP